MSRLIFGICFLLTSLYCFGLEQALPPIEKPAIIKTSDLIPADLEKGPGYTVDPLVSTEGYLGNFTMNTSFGAMKIRGINLLKIRVSEVPAMQELENVSKTEVFAKSMANAAVKPLKSIQKAAENPVETVKGIPSGFGRFFKKTAKAIEKGVDAAKNSDENSGGKSSSGNAAKELAGLNRTRRTWAKQLQIDPYTTNPVLNKQLDDIALATFAGGMTVRVSVPKPPAAIRWTVRISNLVWDNPPEDLEEINKKKMRTMGVPDSEIKAFQKNPHWTITLQTMLVDAIEQLPSIPGRSRTFAPAGLFESEEEARFYIGSVLLLQNYHTRNPISKLQTSGSTIVGITSRNILIVPVDVDYVSWTNDVREFSQREELQSVDRKILISGKLSPAAKKGFQAAGWQFQENYGVN
jgi:hypothetical protein